MELIFNAGLILRKPEESCYALVRRFLIANPGIAYHVIMNYIKNYGREAYELHKELLISCNSLQTGNNKYFASIAYETECRIRLIYGISVPVLPPTDCNTLQISRNCQQCSAMGFHSYLYEFPWIKTCPVHQIELTDHCLECNQPWPEIKELHKRRCIECGSNVTIRELIEAKTFDAVNDFTILSRICQLFMLPKQVNRYNYTIPDMITKERNIHNNMPKNHLYFPTVAEIFYPNFKKVIQDAKIYTGPCYTFKYKLKKVNDIDRYMSMKYSDKYMSTKDFDKYLSMTDFDKEYDWDYLSRKKVQRKIENLLLKYIRSSDEENESEAKHNFYSCRCDFCLSLDYWYQLVNSSYYEKFTFYRYNIERFILPFSHPPPAKLILSENCEIAYLLPKEAISLLFRIDLWKVFIRIHKFITLSHFMKNHEDYFLALSESSTIKSIKPSLGFWLDEDEILHIAVPKYVIYPELTVSSEVMQNNDSIQEHNRASHNRSLRKNMK